MPAPVSTAAASSAKSYDRCRASHPMTTAIRAVPPAEEAPAVRPAPAPEAPGAGEAGGRCSCSQPASAAVAALTTARFIPPLAGGEQRPQLGPVAGIRILADPGLHLGAQTGRDHRQSPAMGPRGPATGPRGPGMSRRTPGTRARLRQTQTRLIWV